jgi:hypothetical protein
VKFEPAINCDFCEGVYVGHFLRPIVIVDVHFKHFYVSRQERQAAKKDKSNMNLGEIQSVEIKPSLGGLAFLA